LPDLGGALRQQGRQEHEAGKQEQRATGQAQQVAAAKARDHEKYR